VIDKCKFSGGRQESLKRTFTTPPFAQKSLRLNCNKFYVPTSSKYYNRLKSICERLEAICPKQRKRDVTSARLLSSVTKMEGSFVSLDSRTWERFIAFAVGRNVWRKYTMGEDKLCDDCNEKLQCQLCGYLLCYKKMNKCIHEEYFGDLCGIVVCCNCFDKLRIQNRSTVDE